MINSNLKLLLIIALISYQATLTMIKGRTLQSTCCSACNQSSGVYTELTPIKFQSAAISAIQMNTSAATFLNSTLKKYPFAYTINLLNRLIDFDARVSDGYAGCGGVDPDGNYYSAANNATVNILFDAITSIINYNLDQRSPNYINTVNNLINATKASYNAQNDNVTAYSQTQMTFYFSELTEQVLNQSIATSYAMTNIAMIMNRESAQTQLMIQSCFSWLNSAYYAGTLNGVINLETDLQYALYPLQFNYFRWGVTSLNIADFPTSPTPKYLIKGYNLSQVCPFTPNVTKYKAPAPPSRRMQVENVSTYNVWVEQRSDTDLCIFRPIFADLFLTTNVSANVFVPAGVDLEELPNGGFAEGEDVNTMWAQIVTDLYAQLLYCKMDSLLDGLSESCPATCDSGC